FARADIFKRPAVRSLLRLGRRAPPPEWQRLTPTHPLPEQAAIPAGKTPATPAPEDKDQTRRGFAAPNPKRPAISGKVTTRSVSSWFLWPSRGGSSPTAPPP